MTLHDVAQLLRFDVSPLELILRGSVMYWFLFLLFRFVLRRDAGSLGIADILVLVLIADAAQNAMAGSYTTIAEGALLCGTLIGWNWLMDWASYRFNRVRKFLEPPPVVLVRHGRLIHRNLRSQMITIPELMANLRINGIEKLADVKMARLEPDGEISVIREKHAADDEGGSKHRSPIG
jgi:uncharacterized membrane protein YcaP (DUF421 family)